MNTYVPFRDVRVAYLGGYVFVCCLCSCVVVTLSISFYPTTSAVPLSFLIHPGEILFIERWNPFVVAVTKSKTKVKYKINICKSSANVPGTRAQQERNPKNKNYGRILNRYNEENRRWGGIQMAQKRKNTYYVLFESSNRWLVHRRTTTKKINMPGWGRRKWEK